MNTLKNDKISIRYNEKDISFSDLTDHYNWTSAFTTRKRNIKKAWNFLEQNFNDNTDFQKVSSILNDNFNLRVHIYCALD